MIKSQTHWPLDQWDGQYIEKKTEGNGRIKGIWGTGGFRVLENKKLVGGSQK